MRKARIIIGANYGDEGKGTVVATYTKKSDGNVLNVLTNGGAQRGHTIKTPQGYVCHQHFGSGTYYGADSYFSRFFILNPMQFVKEYASLLVKPKNIFRDKRCMWSTPYDTMANLIIREAQGKHNTCGMGIWNTIKRYRQMETETLDDFFNDPEKELYLRAVKDYYEKFLTIPDRWKDVWNSPGVVSAFLRDCLFMCMRTIAADFSGIDDQYENFIFENGQGLLLNDNGKDVDYTTPSQTGIHDALEMLKGIQDVDITAHYVTRPYLTRHGDGPIIGGDVRRNAMSIHIKEDVNNYYNNNQGSFRYGNLDIPELKERICQDARNIPYTVELTHCDEIDRTTAFRWHFTDVNAYDSPLV